MKHLLYWSGLSILKLPFLISIIHNKHASDKGSYQPFKRVVHTIHFILYQNSLHQKTFLNCFFGNYDLLNLLLHKFHLLISHLLLLII